VFLQKSSVITTASGLRPRTPVDLLQLGTPLPDSRVVSSAYADIALSCAFGLRLCVILHDKKDYMADWLSWKLRKRWYKWGSTWNFFRTSPLRLYLAGCGPEKGVS